MSGKLDELRNVLAISIAILLLSGGCSTTSEINMDVNSNGTQKELACGQTLSITLESNPSTGYSWQVTEVDKAVLHQSGGPEFKSSSANNPPMPGAGGTETFRFETIGTGTTTLKLVYVRPWEKDVPPVKTFTVQVAVR